MAAKQLAHKTKNTIVVAKITYNGVNNEYWDAFLLAHYARKSIKLGTVQYVFYKRHKLYLCFQHRVVSNPFIGRNI